MTQSTLTMDRTGELMREALLELQRRGGRARPKDIFTAITPRIGASDYERQPVKSGGIRWEVNLRWYSVDCTRAGFITKSGGYWTLTEAGAEALRTMTGPEMIRHAKGEYEQWRREQRRTSRDDATEDTEQEAITSQVIYEQAVEQARAQIEEHVNSLDPYAFQKLVAFLLQGMSYSVRHIASPGPDGGVDIVAYSDPLGAAGIRLKVQVKHRIEKTNVKDVRELEGLIRKDGEMGLLVSSGGFTSEVDREVRSSSKHIETIDLDRFLTLWEAHYEKIPEEGRNLLPLVRVSFLAPQET